MVNRLTQKLKVFGHLPSLIDIFHRHLIQEKSVIFCLIYRNNSQMTSPAFSRASSRRSSIGNEDHISSKFINRDPFKDATKQDVSVPTPPRKYATNSLPRNFSLRPDPLINLDEQKEAPIAEERGK